MDIKDIRSSMDLIRETSKADLIVVSLVLLPWLLGGWSLFLSNLAILEQHREWKDVAIAVVFVAYVVGLVVMKSWDPPEERLRRAARHIQNRLRQRPGHRASFDAIRSEVNPGYTDEFIRTVVERNPELFRLCTIKLSSSTKSGVALEAEEEAAEPGAPADGQQPSGIVGSSGSGEAAARR
jgi:hypothetical protein